MNSLELLSEVKQYLLLKEILRIKTETVDKHYVKLDSFWKIEENSTHDMYGFNSWIKVNLKSGINPSTGRMEYPFVKVFFSRNRIAISIRNMDVPKSELDNTNCTSTVKAAEYLLTYRVDEFMLKIQDRISREKVKLSNLKAKGIRVEYKETFVYALENFYTKFVSLRSCILDNPNKITMGKLTIG